MAVESPTTSRTALLAGATGLTGGALLRLLLASGDYTRIHAVTRRPLLLDHPRLANRILPLEQLQAKLAGVKLNDAFICIGAPEARSGDLAQLRPVDLELVLGTAKAALALGATRLVVVSAAGADRRARQPFLKVKGEMEAALRELRVPAIDVLQPGAVLGVRNRTSVRELLEMVLLPVVNPLLYGGLARRRGIAAADLAAAMLGAARSQRGGVHAYTGRSLQELAQAGRRGP